MGTDAVRTAGSMFSLSRILTRSAAAAGQAVIGELESMQVGNAAEEAASVPVATGVSDAWRPIPARHRLPGQASPQRASRTDTRRPFGPG